MVLDRLEKISSKAFDATAFSILGMLFITKPATLFPTLILIIASIFTLVQPRLRSRVVEVFTISRYKWIARAFLIWFTVSLLLALLNQSEGRFIFPDNAFRMVMALTILLMVANQNSKKWLFCGLFVAGVASAYWAIQAWPWGLGTRAQATTNNPIHFGNLSAIVMLLSLTTALLDFNISGRIRILLFMSAMGGLFGSVASLSRSSFVVCLFILPLGLLIAKQNLVKWIGRGVLIVVIPMCIALLMSTSIRDKLRISEAMDDIKSIQKGEYTTSIGNRFVMWQTAWNIFKENPILGVGPGHFQSEFTRRMKFGEIPETVTQNQPHSDVLHSLSSGGVLKLSSYLGILFAPFVFFFRLLIEAGDNAKRRLLPILGMQVVVSYFLTGLTNSNFDLQIYSTTYAVLVCVLAKLSMQPESTS